MAVWCRIFSVCIILIGIKPCFSSFTNGIHHWHCRGKFVSPLRNIHRFHQSSASKFISPHHLFLLNSGRDPMERKNRRHRSKISPLFMNELIQKIKGSSRQKWNGPKLLSKLRTWLKRLIAQWRLYVSQKYIKAMAAFILLAAVTFNPLSAFAVGSGGRMGGSFGPSFGGSASHYSSPSHDSYHGTSFPYRIHSPYSCYGVWGCDDSSSMIENNQYFHQSQINVLAQPGAAASAISTIPSQRTSLYNVISSAAMIYVMASVLLASSKDSKTASLMSPLGAGVSVVQLSVALDIPDRDDPNSILNVLAGLSKTAQTHVRSGVQNLTHQVALELFRHKSSIVAASSLYSHFPNSNAATREFSRLAFTERGKFERETVNKFGDIDDSDERQSDNNEQNNPKATMAIVSIILAIEGDTTKLPKIFTSHANVEDALTRIASDVKVDDCLESAEILWTPEERTDTLSKLDVIAEYPTLNFI